MAKDDTPLYTPSRDHLRVSYTAHETRRNVRVGDHQSLDELEGEFDLAIRRIQAEAWQRGWGDRAEYDGALLNHWWGDNPYTREDGGEDE